MSNKSKRAQKGKGPAQVPKPINSRKNKKSKTKRGIQMSDAECTLCDPGHPRPYCPFRIRYSTPLPPVKNSMGFPNIANATAGMFVIFPQFTTISSAVPDGGTRRFSSFIMSTSTNLLGTTPSFDAMGSNIAADNSFVAVTASGGSLLTNDAVYDNYRIWSSCIKLINTVAITSNQGQVCIVPDITADQFLYGGTSNGPLTINDVFSMALPENTMRIGDEHCACFSPEEFPDGVIKSIGKGAFSFTNPTGVTVPTITASVTTGTEAFEPKGIIIAVRDTSLVQLLALLIRQETLIEALYAPSSGIVRQARLVQSSNADDVVQKLSKKSPNWRKLGMKALNTGVQMAGNYVADNGPALLQRLMLGAIL